MSQPVHISIPIQSILDDVAERLRERQRCECFETPDDGPCAFCRDNHEGDE